MIQEKFKINTLTLVKSISKKYDYCLLTLPGRGEPTGRMIHYVQEMNLPNVLIASAMTPSRAWYPMPRGAYDQQESIEGLNHSVKQLHQLIKKISISYHIPFKRFLLNGFSAGGVLSLWYALTKQNIGGVYVNSGAILDPNLVPSCTNHNMPILIQHNYSDDCFEWFERFIPTKRSLIDNNYNAYFSEKDGFHTITRNEVVEGSEFFGNIISEFQQE